MYRIIGGDGREYGPVSPEQIQLWIAQRRAGPATQVRHETRLEWTALDQVEEFAAELAKYAPLPSPPPLSAAPPPVPSAVPELPALPALPGAETSGAGDATSAAATSAAASTANATGATSGRDAFPAGAESTGANPPPLPVAEDPLDATVYYRRCLERQYEVRIGDSISRGYDIVARQFWPAMGAVLLATAVQMIVGALPVIGAVQIALEGVFDGGLALFFLGVIRNGNATVGDAFSGFRIQFSQLMLLSLGRALVVIATVGISLLPLLAVVGGSAALASRGSLNPAALGGAVLFLPLFLIPAIYLFVSWTFAPFLIIDRGLGFWDAMELSRRVVRRRWFKLFFLHVAFLPIHLAGLMCFGVGAIYTSALKRATLAGIYEEVFRE